MEKYTQEEKDIRFWFRVGLVSAIILASIVVLN